VPLYHQLAVAGQSTQYPNSICDKVPTPQK
jgi:hypothetical protein